MASIISFRKGGSNTINTRQLIRVARLYYEFNYKQERIAKLEGISITTVSRLLDKAHKEGLIQIKVVYPLETVYELSESIRTYFDLKKVFVAPVTINHPEAILNDLGQAVNNYLIQLIRDGDIIGVSWGTTLPYVVRHLYKIDFNNLTVVQLNGGVTKNYLSTQSGAIVSGFANAFNAVPYMLPTPTIVDSTQLAKDLTNDSSVKETLDLAKEARITLFGIGRASGDSILKQAGFFNEEQYANLIKKGAVGDICSRYFSIDGSITDEELNQRTIGITLEELATKEHSIAIAHGEEKAEAIIGALRGGYINTLFTDELAAQKCIEILKRS